MMISVSCVAIQELNKDEFDLMIITTRLGRNCKVCTGWGKVYLSVIRAAHNVRDGDTVRFHSDMDKSFEGEVKAYGQDGAWIKTMAEWYASKYGAR